MPNPTRRGLHGQVVEQLGLMIISGQQPSGATLDPEVISEELSVSRTVVREAFKVLAAKGLVDARPKVGTYILPRREWNLLDADIMTWRQETGSDRKLLLDLQEVRQMFEPAGARLAAERGTEEHFEAIAKAMERLRASVDGPVEEGATADFEFHRAVLEASGNELVTRFEVMLEPVYRARNLLSLSHLHTDDFIELHQAVVDRILARDAEGAASQMHELLEAAARDTAKVLQARA